MADEIDVNKVSPKDKRRAEHIKDRLEHQGMGQDHAEHEALKQAVAERGPNTGGKNSAGDTPHHATPSDDPRADSEKKTHSSQS